MVNFRNCLVSALILFSCSSENKDREQGPERKMAFVLEDSVVVDVLEPLVMDDQQLSGESFLMRGMKSRKPYLVNKKGKVIKEYDILDEGPNGVGPNGAFGYNFLGEDQWVAQGLFNGYHVYNLIGEKTKLLEPIHLGIYSMSIHYFQTFFRGFQKGGEAMLLGVEENLFNPESLSKENLEQPMYYDSVKTVFSYRVNDQKLTLLETYPENWTPKKERQFVGNSKPLVAYHRNKHQLALLPQMGNQLFIYDNSSSEPLLIQEVLLSHRFRPLEIPAIDKEAKLTSVYPNFTDLRFVGDRLLVEFHTKIPEDIMKSMRAKSENYYDLPAYKIAVKTFVKPYYLIIENGKQIGVVEGFPVHGALDFTTERGEIFINDNVDPEVEREYNVFYILKLED